MRHHENVTSVTRWKKHLRICLAIFFVAELFQKGDLAQNNSLAQQQL